MISVRLAKFGLTSLHADTTFQIVWKRGPEKQCSHKIELNEFELDSDLEEVMSKVSSFYSKDTITYEKKDCNFIVMKLGEGDYQ